MAIWMGLDGGIRTARTATEQIYANVSNADVGVDQALWLGQAC